MRRHARTVAFTLLVGGSSLFAQGSVDQRLSRLDARTRAAVVPIIDSARVRSLPTEPLIDKALEGAAKKATTQQIAAAVRTYAMQLAEARQALGESSIEELIGGAQAIRAGISAEQLGRLRRARPGAQIATALTVVSDLASRLVPIDTALSVVADLMRASVSDDQLLGVRSNIETDILNGQPPAVSAVVRGHALEETLAAGAPPNGAGGQGALPSPSGKSRAADGIGVLKPPGSAVGQTAPAKPPIQRKHP